MRCGLRKTSEFKSPLRVREKRVRDVMPRGKRAEDRVVGGTDADPLMWVSNYRSRLVIMLYLFRNGNTKRSFY